MFGPFGRSSPVLSSPFLLCLAFPIQSFLSIPACTARAFCRKHELSKSDRFGGALILNIFCSNIFKYMRCVSLLATKQGWNAVLKGADAKRILFHKIPYSPLIQ